MKNTRRTSTSRAKALHREIRELKHVGRQHDDDGQNKFLQINDSKENLSYIIIRMNLIQYKKLQAFSQGPENGRPILVQRYIYIKEGGGGVFLWKNFEF
jgi:hypothetical protein